MDKDILAGIARHVLTSIGGSLAAAGYIKGDAGVQEFVGAGLVLLGIAWSWWQKRGQAQVLAAVTKAGGLVRHDAPVSTAVAKAKDVAAQTTGLILFAVFLCAAPDHVFAAQKLRTDSVENVQAGSTVGAQTIQSVINNVKQFTIDDLTAAAADAEAQTPPDPAGECWRVLIPMVQAQQSLLPKGLGLAQAIQKARDIQRQTQAGVPDQIKAKCAIILWDAEGALLKLGIRLTPLPVKLPF